MKKSLSYCLLFLLPSLLLAQTEAYEWVAIGEAEKYINLTGMDVDEQGRVYICGRNEKNARFYSANGSSFILQEGRENFYYQFLSSYDQAGTIRWVQGILPMSGNSGLSYIDGASCDGMGHVYVTGATRDRARFTSADGKDSVTGGFYDYRAFVAKYDTEGNLIWLRIHTKFRHTRKLHVDKAGHIYAFEDYGLGSGLQMWSLDTAGNSLGDWDIQRDRRTKAMAINDKGEIYSVFQDFKKYQYDLVKWTPGGTRDTLHHMDYSKGEDISNFDKGFYENWLTNYEYINQIGFDKQGNPQYYSVVDMSTWPKKRVMSKTFYKEGGNRILVRYDDKLKIKWSRQFNDGNYNVNLNIQADGSFLFQSPASYSDSLARLSESISITDYGSQWVHDLVYRRYDADGNRLWSVGGGGTASNYHGTRTAKVKGGWVVASDIVYFAVLNGDTIKGSKQQNLLYIAKLKELLEEPEEELAVQEPETDSSLLALEEQAIQDSIVSAYQEYLESGGDSLPADTAVFPSEITRNIDLLVYPNPNQGVFKLEITSDKATRVHIMLSDMQGKQLYSKDHVLIPGKNTVEFDISEAAPAYYILKVTENGKPFTVRVGKR